MYIFIFFKVLPTLITNYFSILSSAYQTNNLKLQSPQKFVHQNQTKTKYNSEHTARHEKLENCYSLLLQIIKSRPNICFMSRSFFCQTICNILRRSKNIRNYSGRDNSVFNLFYCTPRLKVMIRFRHLILRYILCIHKHC